MKALLLLLFLLVPAWAEAATYWVHPSGNNGACTNTTTPQGSGGNAKTTIAAGIACMASGDTLNIRTGTYNEFITSSDVTVSKSGSSYAAATTIQSYNNEVVTLNNANGCIQISTPSTGTIQYILFKGLICDGVNSSSSGGSFPPGGISVGGGNNPGQVQFIKFDGMEVKNWKLTAVYLGGADGKGTNLWWTNGLVHDNGTTSGIILSGDSGPSFGHCWYIESGNNLIENSECRNQAGFGIHQFAGVNNNDNIYRYNYVHNTGQGTARIAFGLTLNNGARAKVYNNIFANNQNGADIKISDPVVANNTFYGNGVNASCGSLCDNVILLAGSTNAIIRNNIIYNNNINTISTTGSTGATLNANPTSNPNFVNPTAGTAAGFAIQGTSINHVNQGVDASANIGCVAGSTCRDYAGNIVPQGGVWDVGAYEYSVAPAPVNQMVLALSLDEGVGSTAVDVSGQKNNATLIGGATWDNTGVFGKAVMFDGTGYLNISPSSSLALAPAMTLEAWVYPTVALTGFGTVIFQDRYYLYAASESGYCPTPAGAPGGGYSAAAAENYLCATSLPPPNQWSHLAITHDGLNTTVYLNGNVVASKTSPDPMISATANVTVGASIYGEYFVGKMDQLMIYNYARTRPQILGDMSTPLIGAPGKYVEIAAPVSVEISAASSVEISAD